MKNREINMLQDEKRIKKPEWRNLHPWYITVIMIVLAIFYYLPSIITLIGWKVPDWVIFNMPYDLHRALFFIPMLYAAYKFRIKGIVIITVFLILIFLPQVLFISPYPELLIRSIGFVVGFCLSSLFFAMALNTITERKRAEEALQRALEQLEYKVAQRTKELNKANLKLQELDRLKSMFIASMSHDQRQGESLKSRL